MVEIVRKRLTEECIGCELANDIVKCKDIKLLSKGVILTPKIVDILKSHEVKYIYIVVNTGPL